jgi:radical SAM protein with 4Fe4S-binding SPASM domain
VQLLDSEVNCGNVRKKPLSEILKTNDILNALRDRNSLKGKCGRCRYKHTCGGCRALAYYKTGNYLHEDPICFFDPVNENIKSEYEQLQNENTAEFIDFISHTQPWSLLFDSL